MDPIKEKLLHDYAWAYFSFHADQRMKTFNFFIILAGLVSGGIVTLMRDNDNPWIVAPLGLALSMLCLLFWRLDQRNHVLVSNGEAAVKFLDSQHDLATSGGTPHVLCIFERDDFNRKGESRSLFRKGYFSYSQVIRYVYGLFACLGVFFAVVPFVTVKSTPTLSVQLLNAAASATLVPVAPDSAPVDLSSGNCGISNLLYLVASHATDPKTLNTVGLLLNIVGVGILFCYGFPQPTHEEGISLAIANATPLPEGGTVADHNAKVKKMKFKYRCLSMLALSLILLGFAFEVWATWK